MILRPVEKKIGENTFLIRKFEPWYSLEVLGDLQKRVLGPAAGLIAAVQGPGTDADADNRALEAGIKALSQALSGPDMRDLCKLLLDENYISVVTRENPDGQKLNENVANATFEDAFELIELCVEVALVNYKVFGIRARSLIGRIISQAK